MLKQIIHHFPILMISNQTLIYLDANNLYGWAMSKFLPTHGFRFLSKDEITALKLEDLSDDDEDGYIYEVDLHYPTKLHNPCSESAPQKKLTPNLHDKTKYVVYSRNYISSLDWLLPRYIVFSHLSNLHG